MSSQFRRITVIVQHTGSVVLCQQPEQRAADRRETEVAGSLCDFADLAAVPEGEFRAKCHPDSRLQVLNDYARDERNCGMVPLSVSRVVELVSVLRAIGALIEDLVKQPKEVIDSLYGRLVDLYPVIVQMIPCCAGNSDVQLSVMIALNSYQTLLKIRK